MQITALKSKIHRAAITQSRLDFLQEVNNDRA